MAYFLFNTSTYGRTWWSMWDYTSTVDRCDPCLAWTPLRRPPSPIVARIHCRVSSAGEEWALCLNCQWLRGHKEEEKRAFIGHVPCSVCAVSDIVTQMKHDKDGCPWLFESCNFSELNTSCVSWYFSHYVLSSSCYFYSVHHEVSIKSIFSHFVLGTVKCQF